MAGLILTIQARAGLVAGLPVATAEASLVYQLRVKQPSLALVAQPAGDAARADGDPGILKEGQQAGLADIGAMAEGQGQGLDVRAKLAMVAGGQAGGDRLPGARDVPDLTHELDDVGLQEQILDDHLGRAGADRIGWEHRRVNDTALGAGGYQDAKLAPFLARFGRAALLLRGMIGWRRRCGRGFDGRFARATLEPRQLITQLLVFSAQGLILGHQRLDQVEQLPDELPSGRVGDRIKVDVRNLHTDYTMRARH